MPPEAIIIGGGLAGLTAAAHLAARGVRVTVLEANRAWLGGRLAGGETETFIHDGREWSFPSEHGIHGLWGGYVNMRATLARFITDPALAPLPSGGEVWINRWREEVRRVEAGSIVRSWWIPAPFHYVNLLLHPQFWGAITPLDFLSLPGLLFSILWTVGYNPLAEESALDGLMMDDFFRGWTPNLRATVEGVTRNLLAAPDEAITLTGLIAALRFYTLLRRDSWNPYFFPCNSRVAVIQPLEDAIIANGGVILRGVTARQLQRNGDGWQVRAERHDGQAITHSAPSVILATHGAAAQTILNTSPDTRPQAEAMRFPKPLRNATVRLWFSASPRDQASSGMFTGDFVPDNYFWLHRIHREFSDWAQLGGSAVELHFYGDAALLNQPDKYLLVTATNEIMRAFPELKGALVHGAVRRNSATHTAFRVMTADVLHVHTPYTGIYACGDWVRYETDSLWMERACTTGIAAANGVLAEHALAPYPIATPPPPEALARWLGAGVRGVRAVFKPLVNRLRRARASQKRG
jgi:isorenieratene synthase